MHGEIDDLVSGNRLLCPGAPFIAIWLVENDFLRPRSSTFNLSLVTIHEEGFRSNGRRDEALEPQIDACSSEG